MKNAMISLMDNLDIENWDGKNYKWPFYLIIKDSEHMN
jgi:hypothetical protein